jgi:hypothetical protein
LLSSNHYDYRFAHSDDLTLYHTLIVFATRVYTAATPDLSEVQAGVGVYFASGSKFNHSEPATLTKPFFSCEQSQKEVDLASIFRALQIIRLQVQPESLVPFGPTQDMNVNHL